MAPLEPWEEITGTLEEVDETKFATYAVIGGENVELPTDIELPSELGISVGVLRTDSSYVIEVINGA